MALTKVDAQLLNGAVTADSSGNILVGTSSSTSVNGSGVAPRAIFYGNGENVIAKNATQEVALGPDYLFANTNNAFRFGTNNTERMRIDSSGNLLVNTTNPTAVGAGAVFNYSSGGGTYLDIGHPSAAGNGYGYVRFVWNGNIIGQISQNGTTAVTYATSSDYRLKENIAPMTGALNTVAQLKPVTYNWKADGSASQGFIAHELQAIVPDCVTGEKDAVDADGNPVYQGIDTSFLVATLTAAIQELKAELDATKAEVAALKAAA